MRTLFRLTLLSVACITGSALSQQWSFAVLSDPLGLGFSYRKALREIRDMNVNPNPGFPKAECLIVNGDIGGINSRLRFFRYIFRDDPVMKALYPSIGNHESRGQREIITGRVIPTVDSVRVIDTLSFHYCVDWNNARFLILNQYSDEAMPGCLGQKAIEWVFERTVEARENSLLQHVFIFMHEPAFPRHRHLDDSFNECPKKRNIFWRMLVANRDMVRAVFNGHTHTYSRIRVADPESAEANNPSVYPQQKNGVYQIDSGASGQGDIITIVRVVINGQDVAGRTVEANERWGADFKMVDAWKF